jgi:hypothetical protein
MVFLDNLMCERVHFSGHSGFQYLVVNHQTYALQLLSE